MLFTDADRARHIRVAQISALNLVPQRVYDPATHHPAIVDVDRQLCAAYRRGDEGAVKRLVACRVALLLKYALPSGTK